MVMNTGVMERFGTLEEVYNRPASTFGAGCWFDVTSGSRLVVTP